MRFNPLLVVGVLLGAGALAALPFVRESTGLARDESWQLAVIHTELALAPLLFLPSVGGRKDALANLLSAAACWACAAACVLLFSFPSLAGVGWQTRGLGAAVWLFASGLLALAARGGGPWVARARAGMLAVFALPPLWHYLTLEYAGASALHLRVLSPNWAVAAGDVNPWWLAGIGLVAWVAAFAWRGGRP